MTTPAFDEFRELSLFDEVDVDATSPVNEPESELDPVDVLGDLYDLVDDIFRTWSGGGEEKWAAQAFVSLRRQGVLSDGDPLDYVTNAVLLCTVAALSREFYSHAFDEGGYGDWYYEVPNVIGEYPQISPVALGRLGERLGVSAEPDSWDEDAHDLLRELIRHHAPEVASAFQLTSRTVSCS